MLFGESLGAWTSQDAFVDRGTQGLVDAGIDYAIWIGTPHISKWKEQVLYDDRPDVDRALVGVLQRHRRVEALDRSERERIRYVMITHYDDGVGVFGPELAIQAPDWLGDRRDTAADGAQGHAVDAATTFFQILVDMKNAANVVPGRLRGEGPRLPGRPVAVLPRRARPAGHSRAARGDPPPARGTGAAAQPMGEGPQVVGQGPGGRGARPLDPRGTRRGRDTDERLLELVRAVAMEEFDAGGAAIA